jgi:tetratricopeptide (TPR) repeat protein
MLARMREFMSTRITRLVVVAYALVLFSARFATPQTRLKGRVQTPEDHPLVAREQVAIDGAGQYDTKDHGEFEFDLAQGLKVGQPARFHVYHVNPAIKVQQWIVVYPCDLRNGRKDSLPAVGSEPITIVVLPKGDQRLKSLNKDYSILGCIIEEEAAEFEAASRSRRPNRSSLHVDSFSVIVDRVQSRDKNSVSRNASFPSVVDVASRIHPQAKSSVASLRDVRDSAFLDQPPLLARKAAELGFTPEELLAALDAWARSVEDRYQRGLAALYERHYADASSFISASIPSPPGEFLKRYVPLARAEYEQGHYPSAEAALRKVLVVHNEDPLILNNLAVVLAAEAKYEEAEPLYKQALEIDEKALGRENPTVATYLNNLALLYYSQGKYAEAEPLYKRALAIDEKLLGPSHPDVAAALGNLGLLYSSQGKYAEAEPLYKRALAIDEKTLGPEHPTVAIRLNTLAELYRVQGKYAEAEPLYKRALAIDEKALGPEHPTVATRLNNLAVLYSSQGNYAEAEPLYKRALAIDEKTLGPEHPTVAIRLNNLAELYRAQGKYAEAEPLYKRALAIDEKALGPEHPTVATNLNNLAGVYRSQGEYEEALPLFKRALTIDEKALGPEHPTVARDLNNLAGVYKSQGEYPEAELLYKRAVTINEKALGPDHPAVATNLNNLAGLYDTQGKYAEAEPLYERALTIDEKALGPDHPAVATIAENLGADLRKLGRDAEAKVYEEQAARIRAKRNK